MSNRNNIEGLIKKSHDNFMKKRDYFHLFNGMLPVYIKDPLPEGFDIHGTLSNLEKMVPKQLFYNIDVIMVGDFEEFHRRQVNAMYQNGAIYVANDQDNPIDMIDDIIHELAHAIEESFVELIYGDNTIQQEFLGKRKRLLDILKQEGYNIIESDFLEPSFSLEFDSFLFHEIGYPTLSSLTMGLFFSPYAITSLSEYFANGFENYLLSYENRKYIKNISPHLFNKIEEIIEGEHYEPEPQRF